MFFLKKFACRAFQLAFRAALPILPYREPEILSSCEEVGTVLRAMGAGSVLILTSSGNARRGLIAPTEKALSENNIRYTVYDWVQPDPTVANVEEALSVYRENGCDALVAIGGGSVMDCAKGVGARAVYPKRSLAKLSGVMRVLRRLPTLIAIPTTAGTGSETTLAAVITDEGSHQKYAIMSFPLIPHYAVLDPSLTYTLPPHLTATTGMDALTHAVEAYIGRSTTRKTRRLALEATALIFGNIERAYASGQDEQARAAMLRASYMAGVAFSMSYVGYVHAIAHSIGGKYGTPHGLANAVIMPCVLRGYGKSAYKKLCRLGVAAGACRAGDSPEEGAEGFIRAIEEMNGRMGIPKSLSALAPEDIPMLAARAAREANPLYPVPRLMAADELARLYEGLLDRGE